MAEAITGRKRGAQPANTNRLKHGLYSRRIAPADSVIKAPPRIPEPMFQIAFARKRLARVMRLQVRAPIDQWLSYERCILHYLSLIASLAQFHASRFGPDLAAMALDIVLIAVAYLVAYLLKF